MMTSEPNWFVKTDDGKVYGPADVAKLVEWAKDGRIESTSLISHDRIKWSPAPLMKELEMNWIVETELGKLFGPLNHEVVSRLINDKTIPASARIYRLYDGNEEHGALAVVEPRRVAAPRSGAFFRGANREQLSALEAAVRRELAAAQNRGVIVNLFGGKKK